MSTKISQHRVTEKFTSSLHHSMTSPLYTNFMYTVQRQHTHLDTALSPLLQCFIKENVHFTEKSYFNEMSDPHITLNSVNLHSGSFP